MIKTNKWIFNAAIGDAYGAAFEYSDPTPDRPNDLAKYYLNTKHNLGSGRYTDDTEMTTAVAEAMLEGPLTKESLAKWFVKAFQREKRIGYAGRFYDFLSVTDTGEEFLKNIKPHSDKSGAAMRGWICGLYKTPELSMEMAEIQAKLTHDTDGGIMSAKAAALITHFFAYKCSKKSDLVDFLMAYVPANWNKKRTYPVGEQGLDAVWASIEAIISHNKMSDILKQCVNFGGDVDTVATIALGSVANSAEIEQDLPIVLLTELENKTWGQAYLNNLDSRLYDWTRS